jgi:hypothetical protein
MHIEVESALARPPAKADLKTILLDMSTGGETERKVAASKPMFLNAFVSEETSQCQSEYKDC